MNYPEYVVRLLNNLLAVVVVVSVYGFGVGGLLLQVLTPFVVALHLQGEIARRRHPARH